MLSQDEMDQILQATPTGQKRTVQVRVEYKGANNYPMKFTGTGTTPEGILVCLGAAGTSMPNNRYVFTFQAIHGNYLTAASFVNPATPPQFDFVVGVIANPDDPCCITADLSEFEAPAVGLRETIVFVNLKKNSSAILGYRFTIWVTHHDGTVVAVPCDPRIINR